MPTNDQLRGKQAELEQLQAKIDDLLQQLLTLRAEEKATLDRLATKHLELDHRERYLAEREDRVMALEKGIARNSNLLDM